MRYLNYKFCFIVLLGLVNCRSIDTSEIESIQNELSYQEPFTDKEKQQASENIALLFEDPSTCTKPTPDYNLYLKWQDARIKIEEQMIDATDANKLSLFQELSLLDQNYKLFSPNARKIEFALVSLSTIQDKLFKNQEDYLKIQRHDNESYESWYDEREELVKKFNEEKSEQKKMLINKQINRLDKNFKLRFTLFLLNHK